MKKIRAVVLKEIEDEDPDKPSKVSVYGNFGQSISVRRSEVQNSNLDGRVTV